MEVKAESKWVRSSARKVRRVVDLVRGKPVKVALAELSFMPHKGARLLEKVIKSAAANAKNNFKLKEDILYVSKAYVDEATALKRFRAAARGRAAPRLKRSSHITVYVSESPEKQAQVKERKE